MAVISKKATKRRKTSRESDSSPPSPHWSGLPVELWESILNRLSVGDLLSAGAVCRSWCSVAEARKSSLVSPLLDQPLVLLPGKKNSLCLYNFTERKFKKQMMNIPEDLGNCKGSSHGWLFFLDEEAFPYIFNPFLGAQIQLPLFWVDCKTSRDCFFVREIKKVVLTSDPIHSKNKFLVAVIYGDSKLAFWKCGDGEWTVLHGAHQAYCDIISHNNHIIALGETGSVEIWDFNDSTPVKKMDIQPIFPEKKVEFENSLGDDLYTIQSYVVESNGELMLIMRYIGNHVRWDGVVIHEADLLDEENQCCICPHLTKQFHVYKLDFSPKKWVELEALGDDRVLFLGRNQSVSHSVKDFPFCKGNSIYFTDNYYCDHLGENDMYGHDTGRFDMENQSIEVINEDEDDWQKIQPAPIWVVPNPC